MRLRMCVLVLVISIAAAGCGLPYLTPPGAAPLRYRDDVFTTVTTTPNLTYGSAVDQLGNTLELKLDMYRPAGDTTTSRPAIVWVHGGGFSGGNRTSGEIVDQANTFARKGYVNVSITYRLVAGGCSAGGPTPSCLTAIRDAQHDAQAAVRFLRKNAATYGVDPSRIAIGGTSAGAITALNVGAASDDPGTSGNPGFSSSVRAAVSLSGSKIYGALTGPDQDAAILMFHGTADTIVPYQWAVTTLDEARAANLFAYLTTWEGAGHVPYGQHRTEILDQTSNFLYWTLDLQNAA
jgi:para-nitrobenzyl esterase